jgi:uncharacterized membrane protein YfcA
MNETDYLFLLVAYLIAGSIKGLTGIGFSTSCLPILALRLDLKVAIPLVIVPSIVSNLVVMVQAGDFRAAVKRFWPMYLASVPGLLAGLALLVAINANLAKAILGLVLIAYALWALSNKSFALSGTAERLLKLPTGFCTGFVNGLTGSQVLPVLPYLLSIDLGKKPFVQAINISFTISSLIMLFGMNRFGYFTLQTFLIALIGLIPVLTTVTLGGKLQQRLAGALHRRLVLVFLFLMGLVLLARLLTWG